MISVTVWSSCVAVVGGDEMQCRGEVAIAVGVDVGDGDTAEFFGRVFVVGFIVANATVEMGFAGEGGFGAEGVEVEVKGDGGERLAGEVFVGDGFDSVEGLFIGVETGVNRVGDYACGEGLTVGGVGGDAGLRLRGDGSKDCGSGGKRVESQHRGIVSCFGF